MNEQALLKEALMSLAADMMNHSKNGQGVNPASLGVYLHRLQELQEQFAPEEKGSLASRIREWVMSSQGNFESSDVIKELGLSSSVTKQISTIMGRLAKEGLVVRHGKRRGAWRVVDRSAAQLNWMDADVSQVYDLRWPFGLERLVKLYPKNLVVIAGDSNAGKTAFLLNVVERNVNFRDIDYFTNELGEEELKERLLNFQEAGMDMEAFKRCNFLSRTADYLDVIHPDRLTIIDYLMVTKDAYLIGDELDAIFRKLNKGIAIVAIQKKKGELLGRGKDFALERPRLYMTMGDNKLNIIKGKNWVDKTVNPNGKFIPFKLWGGCKFVPQGGFQGGNI